MRETRRGFMAGFCAVLTVLLIRRPAPAASPAGGDPVRLVDGWLLRQSDLDALAALDRRRRS